VHPHLEVKHKVRKVKFNLVSTNAEVATSKSYVDAYVAWEGNLKVTNLIITFGSTNLRFSLIFFEVANFSKNVQISPR
jgi:hypothetical protein